MTGPTNEAGMGLTYKIEHTPAGHFRLHLARLARRIRLNIYRMLAGEELETLLAEHPWLESPIELEAALLESWLAEFEAFYLDHLPIRALQQRLGIGPDSLDLLLAAGWIEEDIRYGALYSALQHPLAARQPCLGLLDRLLEADPGSARSPGRAAAPALRAAEELAGHGLLNIRRSEGAVRLEWTVSVPVEVWDALRGEIPKAPGVSIRYHPPVDFPPLEALMLPAGLWEQVRRLPDLIHAGALDTLVLRGLTGSGRRTTLGALARSLRRGLLVLEGEKPAPEELRLLGPLATLTGALPVLRLNVPAGETRRVDRLPGYAGTLGLTLGRLGGIDGSAVENAVSLTLPPPDRSQRLLMWQASGLPLSREHAEEVADRFLLTGGRIRRTGRIARSKMSLAGRSQATPEDVRRAMRLVNRQALETLAAPIDPLPGWSRLAVPDRVEEDLLALEARCRHREQLQSRVGPAFERNLNRGVRALFSGPSGTGKTLAARALAGSLSMDLYRVDLSTVVNKYIGETEKNLDRVLTSAEELGVILLLDEGDSLMSQRTEVRGSNDRYANLETNFLLQRLDLFEGIIVITSNAAQRIDDAFLRRLDVVIDFGLPESEQRRELWQMHLPEEHQINPAFLERVIGRCKLSGGQIRNTALLAALLALRQDRPIGETELDQALQREYRKASLPYPLAGTRSAYQDAPL